MEHLQGRLIVCSVQSVFGKTIPDSFFFLGQKNPNSEHNLLNSLSWEQRMNQMDAVCCPLFPTATCSCNICSHFLDLFDILRSLQPTSSSNPHLSSLPILFAFTELTTATPSFLPAGGPSWGSLSSIGGASDCGSGCSRSSRPDQSHRFQHLVPTVPDDNVGIPHAAHQAWSNLQHRSGWKGSEGSDNMDTCTKVVQYTLHKYTRNVINSTQVHSPSISPTQLQPGCPMFATQGTCLHNGSYLIST